ncbi:uncharacterized protein [Haliotis asinina]|uniref:uncharacterized protein n=1 Tax=Haliotis asinina TaxID=109174 RepID=UPI003531A7BE
MEEVENGNVYEESDGPSHGTHAEERAGIQGMSQRGAGATEVQFQTVHQQSCHLVGKGTSLAQHIVGCCQSPQGEVSAAAQQQQQRQPATGGDFDEKTSQRHVSTNTTCVVPGTSPQAPGTAVLATVSTTATSVVSKPTSLQVSGKSALANAPSRSTASVQVSGTTALTTASTTTTCVFSETTTLQVPETSVLTHASAYVVPKKASLQVPGTAAFTPTSTSSLLPTISGSPGLPVTPVTGNFPGLTQYNLIQVQQQFGDVTVKGGKNMNIGGTQNVGTIPTKRKEEKKPLTAAQKITKRTAARIQSWTKDMVETKVLKKVKEKLDRGATWVTITGKPGEGKSTTAYMALNNLYSQGRQVYQVVSPAEFNEVIMACSNPVILLDDIFGDLQFDTGEWAKWRPSLRPILDVKHPDQYAEEVPETPTFDQTQLKQTGPNKDKTIIILVGRDYVLKSSLADLGRMADYISSPQYVVDVSSQRGPYERRKIWRIHAEGKHIDFEESVVSQICEADCPHGFPHVCKMFATAYEKNWTPVQMQMFFQAPLVFLRQTLEKCIQDTRMRSLFMAMIRRDGKISGLEMEEDDSLGYECIEAADDLVGSYLKKEDGIYMFDHPSIYDTVSFILSTKLSKFVIENCSLSFINQRLRLARSRGRVKNVADKTYLVANISWNYAGHLAKRFTGEIKRSNLLHVLSHQSLCYSDFVHLLMDCLKTHFHMNVSEIVKLTDNSSKKSFCELLSSSKSHNLIKHIMEKEKISFTQSQGRDILLGVCKNVACGVLKYISGRMDLEVNARYGRTNMTPLMLAAETRDSGFVNQILSLDPDLNAKDGHSRNVLHYLCKNGLTAAVEHVIDMGVEVIHGPIREQPLYIAIENGHSEVVKLLVSRGCDVDKQKGLRSAVRSLNVSMVQYFLDRGAVVDSSIVCISCQVGNINIVDLLFENGASVEMVSSDGDTPLLSACLGNPAVAAYLLKKGASVSQASNVAGDTPLHRAAAWSSAECVDVLLEAGHNVNVQNSTGDTPLHKAAGRGCAECVNMLLEAEAVVNVQNKIGDTPLHTAAGRGNTVSLEMILKAGADVNVQNNTGDTPLQMAAAVWGYTECVDVLLKTGADVNVQNNTGDTPLHEAAWRGSEKCVGVLLKAGANSNVQNNSGNTPLHRAADWESRVCVDAMLKAGANFNVQNNTGDTPLHIATGRESTECIGVLLEAGADVNVQNNTGDTPLHTAAGHESPENVGVLLEAGTDVNVQNNTGDTPLHRAAAAWWVSPESVGVLLKVGADVNVQNNTGDTPLHRAAAAGRESTDCVDVLLAAGATSNVQNNTGDTPLHTAADWESRVCVGVLLEAGADVNVQNKRGDTPLRLMNILDGTWAVRVGIDHNYLCWLASGQSGSEQISATCAGCTVDSQGQNRSQLPVLVTHGQSGSEQITATCAGCTVGSQGQNRSQLPVLVVQWAARWAARVRTDHNYLCWFYSGQPGSEQITTTCAGCTVGSQGLNRSQLPVLVVQWAARWAVRVGTDHNYLYWLYSGQPGSEQITTTCAGCTVGSQGQNRSQLPVLVVQWAVRWAARVRTDHNYLFWLYSGQSGSDQITAICAGCTVGSQVCLLEELPEVHELMTIGDVEQAEDPRMKATFSH